MSWFGFGKPRDPVDAQLDDIKRQGTGMARLCHWAATLLIILFSLASLVSLGYNAVSRLLANGFSPAEVPDAITAGIVFFLVVCADMAMLNAAGQLRILLARRAPASTMWTHIGILIITCVLEATTYMYMAARFERPVDVVAWGLIAVRALIAPILSIYLSMARAVPVGPRDMLYQAEYALGLGLLRNVTEKANDEDVTMAQRAGWYGAAALMQPEDRSRLHGLIAEFQTDGNNRQPPTGGGSPATIVEADEQYEPTPIRSIAAPEIPDADLRKRAFSMLASGEAKSAQQLQQRLGITEHWANIIFSVWSARQPAPTAATRLAAVR